MLVFAVAPEGSFLIDDNRGGACLVKFVGYDISGRARFGVEAPAQWHVVRTELVDPEEVPEHLRPFLGPGPVPPSGPALGGRVRRRDQE